MRLMLALMLPILLAGCPGPALEDAGSVEVVGTSAIPEGIFVGTATAVAETWLNGQLVDVVTDTRLDTVTINSNGLPLLQGETVRPGLTITDRFGDLVYSQTIQSVEALGSRVSVSYTGDMDFGSDVRAGFVGSAVYEYVPPNTLRYVDTFTVSSFADGNNLTQTFAVEATLTK